MKYPRNYKGFKIDVSYFDSMYTINITLGTKLVWTTKTEITPTKEKIQLAIEDCLLINEYDIKSSTMKKLSKDNLLRKILNFRVCKRLVREAKTNGSNFAILCPHYSINIATNKLYQNEKIDAEQLQWDLDELSDYLGAFVSVSDYDDLVVDMTSEESEIEFNHSYLMDDFNTTIKSANYLDYFISPIDKENCTLNIWIEVNGKKYQFEYEYCNNGENAAREDIEAISKQGIEVNEIDFKR